MAKNLRFVPVVVLAAALTGLVCVRLGERATHGGVDSGVAHATSPVTGSPEDKAGDGGPPTTQDKLREAMHDASAFPGPPMTLHADPQRTHRSAFVGPRAIPAARARFDAKAPVVSQVVASRDEKILYFATLAGRLFAIDRATRAVHFSIDLGDRAYGTPLVSENGTIYVGSDAKKFIAVSPDGTIAWRLDVDGEADVAPLEWDSRAGRRIVFAAGSQVYAVRTRGDVAWRYKAGGKVFTAPAATRGGLVVFGSQDGHAYGLRAQGELAFRVALGADVDGAPVVLDDDSIAFGTDRGEVVKLTENGRIAWRTNVGGFIRGTLMAARNGDIIAGTYGPSPRVVRIEPENGRVVRSFSIGGTGAKEFGIHGSPLEDAQGTLYFGAQDDHVYALTPELGLIFAVKMGGDVDGPLTLLKDGTLVVPCDDGTVTLFAP